MQAASDILLGWLRGERGVDGRRRDYYVRQLWDAKGSAPIDALPAAELAAYARLCGWTLARAHARSGDRVAIAAYLGGGDRFDRAIAALRRGATPTRTSATTPRCRTRHGSAACPWPDT